MEDVKKVLNSQEFRSFLRKRLKPLIPKRSQILRKRVEIKSQDETEKNKAPEDITLKYRTDGFIAGGAIANLAHEYINKVPAVINDIDWFFYQFKSKNLEDLHCEGGELYESLGNDQNFNYSIVKVRERGLINLIEIEPGLEFCWQDLIRSFDLNSCEIAYHWEMDKIIYTENFVKFIKNKRIEFTEGLWEDDPLTSFVRAIKKSQDMKVSFYKDEELIERIILSITDELYPREKDCKGEFDLVSKRSEADCSSNFYISKKKKKVLLENPMLLSPLFIIKDKKLCFNYQNGYAWSDFFVQNRHLMQKDTSGWGHQNRSFINEIVNNKNLKKIYFSMPKKKLSKLSSLIEKDIFSIKFINYLAEDLSKYQDLKDYEYNNIKNMHKHQIIKDMALNLIKNKEINWSLKDYSSFLMKLKKEPLPLIGIYESVISSQDFLTDSSKTSKSLKEDFKNKNYTAIIDKLHFIWEEQKKMYHLKDYEDLGPYKNWIREIIDAIDLKEEGNKMRHCVGGYSDKIKKGRSRIFHITTTKGESTLELSCGEILRVNQHRAKTNNNPPPLNCQIAKRFCHYLNCYFPPS